MTQKTFGTVEYRKASKSENQHNYCDRTNLDNSECENRPVLVKNSKLESGVEMICGVHCKPHEEAKLEEMQRCVEVGDMNYPAGISILQEQVEMQNLKNGTVKDIIGVTTNLVEVDISTRQTKRPGKSYEHNFSARN